MADPLKFDPSIYLSENYLVLDWETTNKDKGHFRNPENRIVLGCGIYKGKTYSHFGSEYEQRELCELARSADFVVCHHAKFELGWLARCGVELRDLIVWDTMIGEFVLAGNRKLEGGLSLDETLQRYRIGSKMFYVSALIAGGVCPSIIERGDLEEYCVRDVDRTLALFLRQRRRVFDAALQGVMYGRCFSTPMLADMETRGVQLDCPQVLLESGTRNADLSAAIAGLEDSFGTVNWRSSKQVRELVYDELGFAEVQDYRGQPIRTDGGHPSTGEEVLARLKADTQDQREFIEKYGRLSAVKREAQILESMAGSVREDGGLLYGQFNQTIASNHRLSHTGGKWGLQFGNFPRNFKRLFRARSPGWVVLEGDCPQLEFRCAADLANDRVAKGDILQGVDVHALTSAVTGFNRQDSKPHTFKPLYGGRSGPPKLVAYYTAFREKYKDIFRVQTSWCYRVLRDKRLRIASGLIFYWPDTELQPGRRGAPPYITNTTAIFNYPISSFATADISQLSLALLWHDLRGMASFICNQVHDSGVLEVLEEELDKVRASMVECYTVKIYEVLRRLFDYEFTTRLGLGVKSGSHWGVGEEQKFESKLIT